jgi:hypothetical protein
MITCAALLLCYYRRTLFMPLFFETHLSERPHARARRKKAVEEGGSATRLLRVSGLASVSVQAAWRPLRRRGASLSSVAPSDGSVAESASRRRGRGEAPRVGGAERPERPRGHAGGGRGAHVPRRRDVRGRRRRARVPLLERPGRTGEPRRRRWRRNRPPPLVRAARAETVSASPRALRRGGAPRGRRARLGVRARRRRDPPRARRARPAEQKRRREKKRARPPRRRAPRCS